MGTTERQTQSESHCNSDDNVIHPQHHGRKWKGVEPSFRLWAGNFQEMWVRQLICRLQKRAESSFNPGSITLSLCTVIANPIINYNNIISIYNYL